jgi:hypothetical protein
VRRPRADLPIGALVRISAFWLGLTSIDAVVNATIQARLEFDNLVRAGHRGHGARVHRRRDLRVLGGRPADRSARSATTPRPAGAGASRTSSSAPSSTSCFLLGIATANSLLAITAFVTFCSSSARTPRA